jgi:hypothetical protein
MQIGLPFDWSAQGGDGAFLVSEANRIAVAHLENWRDWKVQTSVLSGPPRSGRSTLARQFAEASGGTVIERADRVGDETLFHAWNRAQIEARPLLLVADAPPAHWTVALPDLRSRLAAVPHVRIEEPDEPLIRALIERGLAQAGTAWAADLIDWLVKRMERSYAAIASTVDVLNRASIASGRKISVALAKDSLQAAGFLPIVGDDTEQ